MKNEPTTRRACAAVSSTQPRWRQSWRWRRRHLSHSRWTLLTRRQIVNNVCHSVYHEETKPKRGKETTTTITKAAGAAKSEATPKSGQKAKENWLVEEANDQKWSYTKKGAEREREGGTQSCRHDVWRSRDRSSSRSTIISIIISRDRTWRLSSISCSEHFHAGWRNILCRSVDLQHLMAVHGPTPLAVRSQQQQQQ